MLKNYFVIAWRNIQRNKGYTMLNIAGLAFGLSAFIVALLYVNYETGFDKWDKQLSRVYRADVTQTFVGDVPSRTMWSPYPLGDVLLANCPEVKAVTRINDLTEKLISADDKQLYINKVIAADSGFLKVFPYKLIYGNANALSQPNQAIINVATSRQLFGNAPAIGKIFKANGRAYTVTGVFEPSGPSHLEVNVCLSMSQGNSNWSAGFYFTYVLLNPGASPQALAKKGRSLMIGAMAASNYTKMAGDPKVSAPDANPNEWLKKNANVSIDEIYFEPVQNIHLNPKAASYRDAAENHPLLNTKPGNGAPVMFFGAAAILVLFLACINYTNLSIARAGKRAKETGIRKVMGADRKQLIFQFLAEAFIQCLVALLLALLLSNWIIYLVNSSFGMQLSFIDHLLPANNLIFGGQLLALIIAVSLISGAYPAFVLSSFKPAKVLKGELSKSFKGMLLRNGLVILQFGISACFIIGMVVVYKQLNFMNSKDPGFSTQQVMVLDPHGYDLMDLTGRDQKIDLIRSELIQIPGVKAVAVTDIYPGSPSLVSGAEAEFNNKSIPMGFNHVHFDQFKVLGMQMASGRDFAADRPVDTLNSIIINQTAAATMGFKEPIGQMFKIMSREYHIIGVVKDNHLAGYNSKIGPEVYAIGVNPGFGAYKAVLVKMYGADAAKTAKAISDKWKTIEPEFPLRYTWLDQNFARLLDKYERFGKITIMLSGVSIIIALMGIFALSAFAAAQRTKEIGIRKVFGASVAGITAMLSTDFLKLVLWALLISFPLAYWATYKWLQEFAYRIELNWLIFLITGAGILIIALCTVSFQAMKAAIVNPIKSLRTE